MYDFGARNYDPALGRWMNVDPLAEEFYEWTGYNYTLNNPVNNIDPDGMFTLSGVAAQNFARQLQADLDKEEMRKLMSGEGREDDYGIDDTGKITLLKKTDDEFDRLFEVDEDGNKKKRGNSFWIPKAKRGQEIIAVDNIAKGILREVINLKEDNVKFKVNGEGQPTLAEFDDFISRFSDYIRTEIAGVRLGDDRSPNVTSVLTYRYHGNDRHTSIIDNRWISNGYNGMIGKNNYVKAHFHTHPYGDHRPSERFDIPLRNNHKNLPFYIIAGGYEKPY